jgi:signal transduction histidine kinase
MNPVILSSARDITDVIEAKKEADAANMQKSEFIAVMAHEIRTPLHQVVGFIELLGMTKLNKEQAGFVRLLQGAAMSLMAVINDLLDYTVN